MQYKRVDPHPDFNQEELAILKFWQEKGIFEKSLEKNPPTDENKFVFYEGPPTANGQPGIHHVLARAFKDIICRYQTMKGKYVKRRAGWDTHGLPVEIEVEKALGLKNKSEIETYGVAEFNKACQESVWKYKKEWEDLTERIGFWLDLKHPYITYENAYIEKVWGVLKQIWDKGLIYTGFKVVPYCPRCGTTLSSHEVAQGYKNIEEETIYVKFALKEGEASVLVWTTTPWTLPANIALAVNENLTYLEVKYQGEKLILAKDRLKVLPEAEVLREFQGKELIGKEYLPLFDISQFQEIKENDYKIYHGDFVNLEEGTGIVHIAPAFGEDDLELKNKYDLSMPITVSETGKVLTKVGMGKFIKEADLDIKEDLKNRNLLLKTEKIFHDYPFCWRCDSVLIYYAKSGWFISVSKIQDKLIANNQKINWIPSNLQNGRFGNFLADAKDWALSRERFWGTPLPIWECPEGHQTMIGSKEELRKFASSELEDNLNLHRPYIDEVKIKCPKCESEATRVKVLIDVWFDSGSMPFASDEYPDNFPADYISEAIDQTRGWFYTMHTISTLLDKGPAYKNVISLAHVLDDKGKKMSKSKGNVISPQKVIDSYGSDALRWYFFTVNAPGEPKRMNERSVELALRQFVLILWNVYSFFVTYSEVDNWDKDVRASTNILDKWILSYQNYLIKNVDEKLQKYDIVGAAREIQTFVTDLSTWYLRRSRKRRDDEFYSTLYMVLINLVKIIAPFAPFLAETIYQNLKQDKMPESVHLENYPEAGDIDGELLTKMQKVREIAVKTHAQRAEAGIRLRQPLQSLEIPEELSKELTEILKEEVNVLEMTQGKALKLEIKISKELAEMGLVRDIIRLIQGLRKKADLTSSDEATCFFEADKDINETITKNKTEISQNTKVTLEAGRVTVEVEENVDLSGKALWLGLKK